ncbi:LEA type 2 family protein [Natronococcus sp. A-GB7]|uniref:LEA type 2 family protein n=1 Tax=Natronococcus sp. A-GB7 TaxID=3037649 RepID=UPI00241FC283|nr:LEA type 2 family protein [Natronococcus sp. A-GB7]MDG5817971.1 LEA type 2 family protein [Natronococcus sp. A-GB7]
MKRYLQLVLAVGLCAATALGGLAAAGVLGLPDAGLEDNAWGEVEDERIEVITAVWVDNPNPGVEVDDLSVEYDLAMNDVALATGSADDVAVPAGNSTTELRTDLEYDRLPSWWASHVRNGETSALEVDLTAHATVGPLSGSPAHTHEDEVETDLEPMIEETLAEQEGEHSLSPVDSGTGAVEPTVEIRDTDAEWGEVTDERTELYLTYEIHNPNVHPLPTPAMTGEMAFNQRSVAEWDAHEVELLRGTYDTNIPPGESREITFVVELDNDEVVDWFATHVDGDEFTDAEIRAQLAMNVDGETVTVPDDEEAIRCEYGVWTDIFVDQKSEIVREQCELLPWASPDDETLEELGATVDLTETDREQAGTIGDETVDSDKNGDEPIAVDSRS